MFFPPMIGYLVVAAVTVLLLIGINRKTIHRNRTIGIRTKHTLGSDEAWDRGHRAAAPYVLAMTVIAISHAVALVSIEALGLAQTAGHIVAVSGWILVVACCVFAWRTADSAAKASPPHPRIR